MGKIDWEAVKMRIARKPSSEEDADRALMFEKTHNLRIWADYGYLSIHGISIPNTGMRLFRVETTGHEVSLTESRDITVLLPMTSRMDFSYGSNEIHIPVNSGQIVPPSSRVNRVQPELGFSGAALALMLDVNVYGSDLYRESSRTVDLSHNLESLSRLAISLTCLLDDVHYGIPVSPRLDITSGLENDIYAYLEDLARPRESRIDASNAKIKHRSATRAFEFIASNFARPITITEVASEAGTSVRSVQYFFSAVYGLTISQAIFEFRMNAARTKLVDPDNRQSVKAVALSSGFRHLGRFSESYQNRYGELPSQTLSQKYRGMPF